MNKKSYSACMVRRLGGWDRGKIKIGERLTEEERDEKASRGDRGEMRCKSEMRFVRKMCVS